MGVVSVVVLVGLAGCNSSGTGSQLARSSCRQITRGLAIYDEIGHATTQQQAEHELARANADLEAAQPIAAQAALDNGTWQALMTTLQEVDRVPIANLKTALDRQCSNALGKSVSY